LPREIKRRLALFLLALGIIITLVGMAVLVYAEGTYSAQETGEAGEVPATDRGLIALSAGIAVAASTIASSIALRAVASAGFAAAAERPELSSYLLILGGLAEGIAIYGLLVAILLLGKI